VDGKGQLPITNDQLPCTLHFAFCTCFMQSDPHYDHHPRPPEKQGL